MTDWDSQLSPWSTKAAFREEKLISESVLQFTAGYSLSGLFALWALLASDIFDGAVSYSGALWIDGWTEYIRNKKRSRDAFIYLSLGSKEEWTKNPLMSTVGDCTRETYECLTKNPDVKRITLQWWNKAGHFADADARLVKGILWLLK